jgi:DNA-binding NtrC family response regulator
MAEKILFVDDEPQVLEGFQRLFRGKFQIETAVSGADALAKLKRSGPYAVVVCDMRMPEMDGARLLAKIKLDFPESVRIMLTGNADQETAVRAVNEGSIFRFLTKPCDEDLFTGTLNAALIQYRLATHKEGLLEKARGGQQLPPESRNYPGFQMAEQKVRELLSNDAVTALPNDTGIYFGKIIWDSPDFVVQRLSPARAIAHPKSQLSRIPGVGDFAKIEYDGGAGEVKDMGA